MSEPNGSSKKRRLMDSLRNAQTSADQGREPEFLSARQGRRQVSIAALLERIVAEFIAEHGEGESQAVQDAETDADRLKLILATADYVIAVESVQVTQAEKAKVIRRAYAELFGYGPLDALLRDDTVTTITLEGADKASVRRGSGDLETLGPIFDDEPHLWRVLRRLLADAGADVSEDQPLVETGLEIAGRRVSVNIAAPPVTILTSVDIRVHPAEPFTLETLIERGFLSQTAAEWLTALARSPHGITVVGETESGKTTVLGLLARLAGSEPTVAVERAGELHLPEAATRYVVRWPTADQPGVGFREQVQAALEAGPALIVLDEVRTDEAQAVGPLLTADDAPRQMWAFRGPSEPKRLISALGMLARRSAPGHDSEALVDALYRKLPFVVTVRRRHGTLQLYGIGEWQFNDESGYPDYVELMAMGWDGLEPTGAQPVLPLD
jgi:pilus assembly protein CpaF